VSENKAFPSEASLIGLAVSDKGKRFITSTPDFLRRVLGRLVAHRRLLHVDVVVVGTVGVQASAFLLRQRIALLPQNG
jgi:hypothetical protein